MQRGTWIMAISVVVALILVNNTIYYFLTKRTLEEQHNHNLLTLGRQIELSVEQTRQGAELFEDQIGRELRAAAIAAQYALDPDVEKVTNEQLVELKDKLDIAHITLLKRTEDDIVLYRSSDPSQLNHSTKTWTPWHEIFNQLFDYRQTTVDWLGQKLDHFWSGPFEVSSTDLDQIYKWGYYHDGTTNYIVDPYVHFDELNHYNRVTGVDRLIRDLAANERQLLEIAVINPMTFPRGNQTVVDNGGVREHIVQRPFIYGTYEWKSDRDEASVRRAFESKEIVTLQDKVRGTPIYKMFIPVFAKEKGISITDDKGSPMDSYVIAIVSDYGFIQERLMDQFLDLGLIIVMFTVLSLILSIAAMRYYKRIKDNAVQVAQLTYTEEINSLFHSIRAQRHDFLNHVQTIHSLAELKKTEELAAYTKELTGEIHLLSDILNIGNPAIAALIRSKISQAEGYKIKFECSMCGVQLQDMGGKTLDINRILGNLIDNAFDEVLKYEEDRRIVSLTGVQSNGMLEIRIVNICEDAERQASKPLFEAGYSTKLGEHQGLGLSIVKNIAERYKGEAKAEADGPGWLAFTVRIPL